MATEVLLYLVIVLLIMQVVFIGIVINLQMKHKRMQAKYQIFMRGKDGKSLEKGFLEMQQYPEGFSVFLPEDPSEYAVDSEEGMFYLVIRAENASEGIAVTATLVDENWDPVQE